MRNLPPALIARRHLYRLPPGDAFPPASASPPEGRAEELEVTRLTRLLQVLRPHLRGALQARGEARGSRRATALDQLADAPASLRLLPLCLPRCLPAATHGVSQLRRAQVEVGVPAVRVCGRTCGATARSLGSHLHCEQVGLFEQRLLLFRRAAVFASNSR